MGSGTINGDRITQININAEKQTKSAISPGKSPGILTFNADFVQTPGGALEIEIGGTDVGTNQDQLIINGDAEIGGTLVLKFIDDFSPQAGQTFDFLSVSGTQTGDFENVEIVDLAPGFEFEVTPTDTGFMMTALSDGMFTGIPGEINDVNIGFNTPQAQTSAAPGDTNVPMLQFEVAPEGDGLSISSLTLAAGGSGNDVTDLAGVSVWVDEDRDGSVGFDESSIGSGTYNADNGTLNLSLDQPLEVAGRETATLLVTYDISGAPPNAEAKAAAGTHASHATVSTPASRLSVRSVGLAALMLPLILGLGFVAMRKPRVFVSFGLVLAATVWIAGCPQPGTDQGTSAGPTTATFGVTLTALGAAETGTGADASVDNLSLAGTNLTVPR